VTPSTVKGTSCGVLAFHWARRWRVLLRDIFRLGTAMGSSSTNGGMPHETLHENGSHYEKDLCLWCASQRGA
jgi:hypothetical protein